MRSAWGWKAKIPRRIRPRPAQALLKAAVDAAAHADVAVVVVGRYDKIEHEGSDLKTMDLPAGQDELIEAVEKANPRTIVVLNTGDPVTMTRWIDKTPALLDMWYGGQEAGAALASILFGDANPSGKLPVTLPKEFKDSPAAANYPGREPQCELRRGDLRRLPLLRHQECRAAVSLRLWAELYERLSTAI